MDSSPWAKICNRFAVKSDRQLVRKPQKPSALNPAGARPYRNNALDALIRSGIKKINRVARYREGQGRAWGRFHLFVDQCDKPNISAHA